jgi:site-specific DNA recombinase
MNAVTYAQCGVTKKQADMSIEDQEGICKAKAKREGFNLVDQFRDDGVHGYIRLHDRDGGVQLLSAVFNDELKVLITESLRCFSADSSVQNSVIRFFESKGIRIIGVTDRYDSHKFWSSMLIDIREIINEMYLVDAEKRMHYLEYCHKSGVKQRTINWIKQITFIVVQLLKVRRRKRKLS